MQESTRQNLGFPSIGCGLLAVFIMGYAWIDGHEFPRITEAWSGWLGLVGLGLVVFGLLLVWPRDGDSFPPPDE